MERESGIRKLREEMQEVNRKSKVTQTEFHEKYSLNRESTVRKLRRWIEKVERES